MYPVGSRIIDGANRWQEFRLITLPSLRGQMAIALTLTITGALRSFDMVYITTPALKELHDATADFIKNTEDGTK